MAAFPDDRIPASHTDSSHRHVLSQFQGDWVDRLNLDQMFVLIDGVLPFEVCLYYQVLPLYLEGNRLNLGMVSPEDTPAADYVRRIISYLNYSLAVRHISTDALQTTLTAYLNASEKEQATSETIRSRRIRFGLHRHAGRVASRSDQSDRLTLIVDSPDELEPNSPEPYNPEPYNPEPYNPEPQYVEFERRERSPQPPAPHPIASPSRSMPSNPLLPKRINYLPYLRQEQLSPSPAEGEVNEHGKEIAAAQPPVLPIVPQLPVLQLEANYLSSPAEVLITLPPEMVLQELLARVLVGGIGRLYFENHGYYGRILWSQNGVLQSVLENVPIALFQEMINALKQMAKVMAIQDYPKQVEAEYLYEKSRVLLRFRFMLNGGSEEATLQILRGAALKFHQQQQVRKLERDAVGIAKQLQIKLSEIRDRAQAGDGLASKRFDVLPGLSDLLRGIEQQLDELGVSQTEQSSDQT